MHDPRRYVFSFALAFRRSAQYRFILRDTSARAAADIFRARLVAHPRDTTIGA